MNTQATVVHNAKPAIPILADRVIIGIYYIGQPYVIRNYRREEYFL